jgi:hypothetical protein
MSVPAAASVYFTLSALDQSSSLTTVFDQYRIVMIESTFYPQSAAPPNGLVTSVIDYDDASTLASVGQALDYSNAMTVIGSVGFTRTFRPHCAVAAYSGAFTSFANEESPWIDCASASVQHYGIKLASTPTSSVIVYNAINRLWLQFRNVR